MVDLPPEIEAQFAACSARNKATAASIAALKVEVDDLVDTLDGEGLPADAVPEALEDDPSVVRHMDATAATAARVRRISTPQPARIHEAALLLRARR